MVYTIIFKLKFCHFKTHRHFFKTHITFGYYLTKIQKYIKIFKKIILLIL